MPGRGPTNCSVIQSNNARGAPPAGRVNGPRAQGDGSQRRPRLTALFPNSSTGRPAYSAPIYSVATPRVPTCVLVLRMPSSCSCPLSVAARKARNSMQRYIHTYVGRPSSCAGLAQRCDVIGIGQTAWGAGKQTNNTHTHTHTHARPGKQHTRPNPGLQPLLVMWHAVVAWRALRVSWPASHLDGDAVCNWPLGRAINARRASVSSTPFRCRRRRLQSRRRGSSTAAPPPPFCRANRAAYCSLHRVVDRVPAPLPTPPMQERRAREADRRRSCLM